jgi:PHD/YefM family antitoxin component YafN of YafNO toxin-antitoxin module
MKTNSAPKEQHATLGKLPVVILPLAEYERMREDLEMLRSKNLESKIKRARREVKAGKTVSLGSVLAQLGLSK